MILKTYSRIFTDNLEATLAVLKPAVGREPELRFPFLDMEVLTLGDFCILAGPSASIKPYLGAVGPIIVDNLQATKAMLEAAGAEIVSPFQEVATGFNLFSRNAGGVVMEWVQWTPEIWDRVNTASRV